MTCRLARPRARTRPARDRREPKRRGKECRAGEAEAGRTFLQRPEVTEERFRAACRDAPMLHSLRAKGHDCRAGVRRAEARRGPSEAAAERLEARRARWTVEKIQIGSTLRWKPERLESRRGRQRRREEAGQCRRNFLPY